MSGFIPVISLVWQMSGQFTYMYGGFEVEVEEEGASKEMDGRPPGPVEGGELVAASEEKKPLKLEQVPAHHLSMGGFWIPNEVVRVILRHLPPEELPRISTVCRVFNEVASSNSFRRSYRQFPAPYGDDGAAEVEKKRASDEIAARPPGDGEASTAEADEKNLVTLVPGLSMSGIWIHLDVVTVILRHLPPEELPRICTVCRVFNQVASGNPLWQSYDLREVFPNARFIGREEWQRYVDVDSSTLVQRGRPYVTKQDFKEVKQMEKQVEGKQGITIMTFFKGRTLEQACDSASCPKEGLVTRLRCFESKFVKELNVECPKTITVAITNGIFQGSKRKGRFNQKKQLVNDLKCRPLTLREAVDFGLMVYRMSDPGAPVRLFEEGPPTKYTLCVDNKKDEKTGGIIEIFSNYGGFGFGMAGPYLRSASEMSTLDGIAGLREFKVRDL
ncbi:MAG: F-box protein [Verrucomicrobia bacterium]|nr:F-box protein [Verrucomicrobiota bacterium]